jgi:hypothetical protein
MPTRSLGKGPQGEVGVPYFLRDSTQLQAARASHKVPNHFDLGIDGQKQFELFSEPSLSFNTEGMKPGLLRGPVITDVFEYALWLLPVPWTSWRTFSQSNP